MSSVHGEQKSYEMPRVTGSLSHILSPSPTSTAPPISMKGSLAAGSRSRASSLLLTDEDRPVTHVVLVHSCAPLLLRSSYFS